MRRSRLRARSRPAATGPRKGRVVASVARWREIRSEAEALAGGCLNPRCRRRVRLDLHHVVKRSAGGADEIWNIVPLCRRCHNATDLPAGSRDALQIRHAEPGLVCFSVWLDDVEPAVHGYMPWAEPQVTPMTPDEKRIQSRERASRRVQEIVKRVDEQIRLEPFAGRPRVDSRYRFADLPRPKGRAID